MADMTPSLRIGSLTVRGYGITAERGAAIAAAVAPALAARFGTSRESLTLRLPASAIGRDGGIDSAALSTALDSGGRRG
ncbi:hypothetical protein Q4F19_17150 [Sphingomonas sp. BIUV-7]|uniref:Uncharacterized protein n=1 Tax=Sphingomonas natans TaxID=3063330 RepID=A0ABT8YCN7_9SPHN|nr:hypothetical protein [Sphingomonas sp. BIUV-7]MDO6416116.1 hypothetical protein [Sphingomonas sp. BIUV-7]